MTDTELLANLKEMLISSLRGLGTELVWGHYMRWNMLGARAGGESSFRSSTSARWERNIVCPFLSALVLRRSRTKFAFSADEAFVALYKKLQARLRHKYPNGKFEDIAKEAFRLLDEKLDPARAPKRSVPPRPPKRHTRYVPQPVRRTVWQRDQSQCTFVAKSGQRCPETGFLQLDHILPWSLGGSSQDVTNLTLRCGSHNRWRAKNETGRSETQR